MLFNIFLFYLYNILYIQNPYNYASFNKNVILTCCFWLFYNIKFTCQNTILIIKQIFRRFFFVMRIVLTVNTASLSLPTLSSSNSSPGPSDNPMRTSILPWWEVFCIQFCNHFDYMRSQQARPVAARVGVDLKCFRCFCYWFLRTIKITVKKNNTNTFISCIKNIFIWDRRIKIN